MQPKVRIRTAVVSILEPLRRVLALPRTARQAIAGWVERHLRPAGRPGFAPSAIGVVLGINAIAGVAAAKSTGVCPSAIVTSTENAVRWGLGLIILACVVTAGVAEGLARLKRDPQEVAKLKKWRNGAAMGTVTAPGSIWASVQLAAFYNIAIVQCIDLVQLF